MRTLVAFHPFRNGEAIHFYRNVLILYARNDDITPELVAMVSAVANVLAINLKICSGPGRDAHH